MTLAAYFDASAQAKAEDPMSMAGYLFYPGAHVKFAREWQRLLKTALPGRVLPYLHMTDLFGGHEEWENVDARVRGEALRRAVEIINAHIHAGIVVFFQQREFERLAPNTWALFHGSIFTTAGQLCLRTTAFWLDNNDCHRGVAYHFEQGDQFEPEFKEIMDGIATVDSLRKLYRFQSYSMVPKGTAGCQAADILAWLLPKGYTGDLTRNRDKPWMRAFAPHMLALAADTRCYQVQQFTGEKLQRFFGEQYGSEQLTYLFDVSPRPKRLR